MSEKQNRRFSPTEKVKAVRRHLIEKVSISTICEELRITPSQYYQWQTQFFENGINAFTKESKKEATQYAEQINKLEKIVDKKNQVIAIIAADNIELKKNLGEL